MGRITSRGNLGVCGCMREFPFLDPIREENILNFSVLLQLKSLSELSLSSSTSPLAPQRHPSGLDLEHLTDRVLALSSHRV